MQIENLGQQSFQFVKLDNKILEDKSLLPYIEKWGIKSLRLYSYIFDLKFDNMNSHQFLLDLFNSDLVRAEYPYISFKKQEFFQQIIYQNLACNSTRLDLFDKLETSNLVVKGHIKQCFEEQFEEIPINDLVRQALILEDSEHYCAFNEQDRQEFIFKLFQILVLGGQLCQYEDGIQPYLDQTKYLYKSIVNARKNPDTEQIYIDSYAFQIKKLDKFNINTHPQNVLYVVVNPAQKVVHLVGNQWIKVW
ncbi:hypothetical protein pb186bvf_019339 [Paramecium bursaria]